MHGSRKLKSYSMDKMDPFQFTLHDIPIFFTVILNYFWIIFFLFHYFYSSHWKTYIEKIDKSSSKIKDKSAFTYQWILFKLLIFHCVEWKQLDFSSHEMKSIHNGKCAYFSERYVYGFAILQVITFQNLIFILNDYGCLFWLRVTRFTGTSSSVDARNVKIRIYFSVCVVYVGGCLVKKNLTYLVFSLPVFLRIAGHPFLRSALLDWDHHQDAVERFFIGNSK